LPGGAISLTGLALQPLGELRYLENARVPDFYKRQALLLRPPLYRGLVNAKLPTQCFGTYVVVPGDFDFVYHSFFLQITSDKMYIGQVARLTKLLSINIAFDDIYAFLLILAEFCSPSWGCQPEREMISLLARGWQSLAD
jgi:hypothetical protein